MTTGHDIDVLDELGEKDEGTGNIPDEDSYDCFTATTSSLPELLNWTVSSRLL